ncbi:MAG: DUF5655 domain-containing protein [Saprospiraceae bacterium]|nr:DUF5655 domain-containing protein [Saprospiraceae bacterium]
MWTCPECSRVFRNRNQLHTCKLVDKELFFENRPPHFHEMYETIKRYVQVCGSFREEAVAPDVIFFKSKSTFLALKIKKRWIDVEFFLDHLEDIPPVKKYLQTSRRRFAHLVSIDEIEDIDQQLLAWIRSSHELITNA